MDPVGFDLILKRKLKLLNLFKTSLVRGSGRNALEKKICGLKRHFCLGRAREADRGPEKPWGQGTTLIVSEDPPHPVILTIRENRYYDEGPLSVPVEMADPGSHEEF